MSSARLFGKMLRVVAGKPMLAYVVERLQRVRNVAGVIVATSDEASDDPIAEMCAVLGVKCLRGDLTDVAGRFLTVVETEKLGSFVRISGDSPMIDPLIVERAVSIYTKGCCDLVSNIVERTFPKGQSVEVVRASSFSAALSNMTSSYDREHVTPFMYRDMQSFAVCGFTMQPNRSHVQLSVDTQGDFDIFQSIVAKMDKPHWAYGMDELIALHDQIIAQGVVA